MSEVAFLGLGVMGQGMVMNLLESGHQVTIWNRSPIRVSELEAAGAVRAGTASAAVAGADFVMYCLSDDRAVREVVLDEGGIAPYIDASSIVIDLSTVSPETSMEEHRAFTSRGIRFLDAPVFGSRGEAAEGRLWIVVGGDPDVLGAAELVLRPLAETIHHLGAPGNGARMKLVGNLLVAAQLESLGEAFVLAKASGLDLDTVHDVIRVTDFRTPIYDSVGAAVIRGDYEPHFTLKLMLKDGHLIQEFAQRAGTSVPATDATVSTIERAVMAGHGDENASALVKVLADDAGVTLERRSVDS